MQAHHDTFNKLTSHFDAVQSPLGPSPSLLPLASPSAFDDSLPSWQLDHLPSVIPANTDFFLSSYPQQLFQLSPVAPTISLPPASLQLPLALALRSDPSAPLAPGSPPSRLAADGPAVDGDSFSNSFLSFLGSPGPSAGPAGSGADDEGGSDDGMFGPEFTTLGAASAAPIDHAAAVVDGSDEETDDDEAMGRDAMQPLELELELELGIGGAGGVGELSVGEGLIGLEDALSDQPFAMLPDGLATLAVNSGNPFASTSGATFADFEFTNPSQLTLPGPGPGRGLSAADDDSDPERHLDSLYQPNAFGSPSSLKDDDFDGPADEFTPPTSLGDGDYDHLDTELTIKPDELSFQPNSLVSILSNYTEATLPPLPDLPPIRNGWDDPEPTSSGRRRKRPAAAASYSWEPTPLPRARTTAKKAGSSTGSTSSKGKGKAKSKSPPLGSSAGAVVLGPNGLPSKNEIPATDDPNIKPYGCAFPQCVALAEARAREKAAAKPAATKGKATSKAAKAEAARQEALDEANETSFRTIKELREHWQSHKKVGEPAASLPDETPFRCALDPCGKTFRSLAGLRFHFQNASANGHFFVSLEEGEERPSKKFKLVATPNGRSEKCPMVGCTKAFKQAAGLAYHLAHAPNHPVTESLLVTFGATLASKTRWWFRKKQLKVGTGEIPSCMRPGNGPTNHRANAAGGGGGNGTGASKKKKAAPTPAPPSGKVLVVSQGGQQVHVPANLLADSLEMDDGSEDAYGADGYDDDDGQDMDDWDDDEYDSGDDGSDLAEYPALQGYPALSMPVEGW